MVLVEDDLQGFGERRVAVEMVEAKPTLLYLFRQLRQTFIDGRPVTEMLQSGRTAFPESLLQMKPSLVVHVVVEVEVYACGRVVQQEPPRLREGETVCVLVYQNGTDAQRCLQKAFHGIVGEVSLRHDLLTCHAVFRVANQVQYSKLHHQS